MHKSLTNWKDFNFVICPFNQIVFWFAPISANKQQKLVNFKRQKKKSCHERWNKIQLSSKFANLMRESIKKIFFIKLFIVQQWEKNENHKNFFRSLILVNCYHFLIFHLQALFALLSYDLHTSINFSLYLLCCRIPRWINQKGRRSDRKRRKKQSKLPHNLNRQLSVKWQNEKPRENSTKSP